MHLIYISGDPRSPYKQKIKNKTKNTWKHKIIQQPKPNWSIFIYSTQTFCCCMGGSWQRASVPVIGLHQLWGITNSWACCGIKWHYPAFTQPLTIDGSHWLAWTNAKCIWGTIGPVASTKDSRFRLDHSVRHAHSQQREPVWTELTLHNPHLLCLRNNALWHLPCWCCHPCLNPLTLNVWSGRVGLRTSMALRHFSILA